jgi:hypothetical protein
LGFLVVSYTQGRGSGREYRDEGQFNTQCIVCVYTMALMHTGISANDQLSHPNMELTISLFPLGSCIR